DTMINFPNDTNISFEKILMLYNIRCKDGKVSPATSGQTDIGCGEWDASCSSYITDSTQVDSTLNFTNSYSITGFSGAIYNYTNQPTYNYIQYFQKDVTVDSIISETLSVVGTGNLSLNHTLDATSLGAKSQYLFTQSELSSAGVNAGDLHGLILNCLNSGGTTDFLRLRLKHTTKTELSNSNPDLSGFTEVYFDNTTFVSGDNRIQFYTPFTWDGTSNIIIEFSFSNSSTASAIQIKGSNNTDTLGLFTVADNHFYFNGGNYIEADTYKGISGNHQRTVEAWINSTVPNNEICSWGKNSTGQKWVFRINSDGTIRVEVNGGYIYGTTTVDDGEWHHVACVYSGTDVVNTLLYVDGVLETSGGTLGEAVNTNTSGGINLRVSRGINNRYFVGGIDEVRVWSTALSVIDLQKWMYKSLDSTHTAYDSLELYYKLNEGIGTTINDNSSHQRNASVINGQAWKNTSGIDLFKEFHITSERPNLKFMQGNYMLTVVNDTVYDSIPNVANLVNTNQIVNKWGTTQDDSIAVIASNTYWQAGGYEYVFDTNGNKIDSNLISIDGTLTITKLSYYRRFPAKFEIMSFVTPYGINLDLGQNGKTWTFDVSDFMPILKGTKRMTVERGGQWMEDMDIRFLFIVGTPPRDILNINQMWRVESKSYTSITAEESYESRNMKLNAKANYFKVRAAITGHGQQGEFNPRIHYIDIDNGTKNFSWQVWKECAENPVYPQGGTWIYDRAGWCPGMPTDLKEIDITPYVSSGQNTEIDYGVFSASGTSNYLVNVQLVSYDSANFSVDAAVSDVLAPSNKVEYSRNNFICHNPKVIIKNTGSTTLTSLTIEYWVNNATQKETYNWTGSLEFLETAEVLLPSPNSLWSSISGSENIFNAEVKNPNGTTDEYSYNNKYRSTFGIPDVLPSDFMIWFKTNGAASESKYQLFDIYGNKLFERSGMSNNTTYKDTFKLGVGCYTLVVLDTDDDGIDFWANNDGIGYIQLREGSGSFIKALEPDFGGSIVYNFTIDYPLTYEELHKNTELNVYPNPNTGKFTIAINSETYNKIGIQVLNSIGSIVYSMNKIEITESPLKQVDLGEMPKGIYFVRLFNEDINIVRRIVIQ
ncbi:LamG-like jellyroll fold domain-containing protein, partial [Bacteroidota bacterium]